MELSLVVQLDAIFNCSICPDGERQGGEMYKKRKRGVDDWQGSRGRAGGPDPSRSQKPKDPEIGVGSSQPGIMPASSARHIPAFQSQMSTSGHA